MTSASVRRREADGDGILVRLVVVAGDHHEELALLVDERGSRNDRARWAAPRRRFRPARVIPAASDVGLANARRTLPVAVAGSTCGALVSTLAASALVVAGLTHICAACPTTTRDSSDAGTAATTCSCAGLITLSTGSLRRRFDEVARVVEALGHDAGERRAHDGSVRRARPRPAPRSAPARDRASASASCRVASSTSRGAATPCASSDDSRVTLALAASTRADGLRDLGATGGDIGGERRNVEPHEQVARLDPVAFGVRQLRDARRRRRDDDQLGARRGA